MNTSNKTLLQILTEELPKRGGWPKFGREMQAVQDRDGEIKFHFIGHPLKFELNNHDTWGSNTPDAWLEKFESCSNVFAERSSDYATAIITREQYEAALADKNDGWIEWGGGECPVEKGTLVDVKYRCGDVNLHIKAGEPDSAGSIDTAFAVRWSKLGAEYDIIAYRLHQPTKSEQVRADAWDAYAGIAEADDEADLDECIGQTPAPVWNGEGLPPVGAEFNYGSHRSRAKCLAVGLHYVFASKGNPDDEEGDYEEFLIDAKTDYYPVDDVRDSLMRDIMKASGIRAGTAETIANQLIDAGYRKQ